MGRLKGLAGSTKALLGRHKTIVFAVVGAFAALVMVVFVSNAYILLSESGNYTGDLEKVPHAQTAIVLGAQVKPNGEMSKMLSDRVEQTARLWRTGKIKRILVSGDHGQWTYDEPDTMRMALQRDGIPGRVIFEDHAGFNTWASMVRAKRIFGVHSAIVVTQGFHMPRALFLADHAGLDATGLTSDIHSYGSRGTAVGAREVLARVKAIGDVTLNSAVVGGKEIPITGDHGQVSWGPAPPAGTPPAGAPRTASASRGT